MHYSYEETRFNLISSLPPPFFLAVTVVRRERILSLLLSVTVTSPKTRDDFENTAFFMMRRRINVMSGCVGSNTNIIYNWGFYIATFLFFLSNSLLRGGGNGMMTRYYFFPVVLPWNCVPDGTWGTCPIRIAQHIACT